MKSAIDTKLIVLTQTIGEGPLLDTFRKIDITDPATGSLCGSVVVFFRGEEIDVALYAKIKKALRRVGTDSASLGLMRAMGPFGRLMAKHANPLRTNRETANAWWLAGLGAPSNSDAFFDVGVSFYSPSMVVTTIIETDSTVTFDERVGIAGQWIYDTHGFDPRETATKVGVSEVSAPSGTPPTVEQEAE